MNLQAGKETIYKSDFDKSIDSANQPKWLVDLRKDAFVYFTGNGFPTIRDEDWKYTVVSNDQLTPGSQPSTLSGETIEEQNAFLDETDGNGTVLERARHIIDEIGSKNRVVFIDGLYVPDLSDIGILPKTAKVLSFAEAYEDETFRSSLAQQVNYDFNGYTALNTAFLEQGIFINVRRNTKIEEPIHIVFIGEKESTNFPRVLYVGETGSEAEIVEHYDRTTEAKYFTNAVVEIELADNARLFHTRVQRESHQATHIVTSEANLNRTSIYDNTNITLRAKLSRHDINLSFNGEGGEAWIDGLYLVEDGQHTDTHSRIDHKVKNCVSHQNYKGILDGKSRLNLFNSQQLSLQSRVQTI